MEDKMKKALYESAWLMTGLSVLIGVAWNAPGLLDKSILLLVAARTTVDLSRYARAQESAGVKKNTKKFNTTLQEVPSI